MHLVPGPPSRGVVHLFREPPLGHHPRRRHIAIPDPQRSDSSEMLDASTVLNERPVRKQDSTARHQDRAVMGLQIRQRCLHCGHHSCHRHVEGPARPGAAGGRQVARPAREGVLVDDCDRPECRANLCKESAHGLRIAEVRNKAPGGAPRFGKRHGCGWQARCSKAAPAGTAPRFFIVGAEILSWRWPRSSLKTSYETASSVAQAEPCAR